MAEKLSAKEQERWAKLTWRVVSSRLTSRQKRSVRAQGLRKPHGVKRQYVPWIRGEEVTTPYWRKELRRRRAAGRAAKQARKANRGR